jgi:nucleoside-diphosphate-sugar epimerase
MRNIFITGAAGYVGEMLCDQLSKREDVWQIIALDKEPQSDFSKTLSKVKYIQANMADDDWQEAVAKYGPDTVVHTAWQIRTMYGRPAEQWRWNVTGSGKVFDLALSLPSVKRLIYFSTASSYSARQDNTFDHLFREEEGFRDDPYLYAAEKKAAEELLRQKYDQAVKEGRVTPQVFVLRPAAITGPRGRYMRIRFGLQSALQGNLKGGWINRLVTLLTSFVPATKGWARQFVHEDDVNDAVTLFTFGDFVSPYEVYNLTPTGEAVFAEDMAAAVGKKKLPVHPYLVRMAFFILWHLTRGRIPTSPGSWRFYSYPILMSGDKLKRVYHCRYNSREAFKYTTGRYETFVPEELRKSK